MGRSRWFFVFIIVGFLLLLVGIATGVSSRSSTYQPLAKGTIAHYLSADGTGYLQLNGSPDLYIVQEGTFSPAINGINTFQDGDMISLVIDPKSTANIDKTSVIGTHLVGTAANVVQIMVFDDASGQPKTTYVTNAYKQDHNGYTQNNWPIASVVATLGLLMAGGAFFMPRRKKPQPAVVRNATASPVAFGQQPMASSSNAPFQGTPQYQNQSLLQRQPGQQIPSYQQSAAPAFGTNVSPFGQPRSEQQLSPYQNQKPVSPFFGIKNTLQAQAQAPTQPTVEQQWPAYQKPATPFFGIKGTYNSQPGLPWLATQQPAAPSPVANNNLMRQQPVEQNPPPYQQPPVHYLGIKNQIKALPQTQQQQPPYPNPPSPPSQQGPSGLLKRYTAANANTPPTQQPVLPPQMPAGLEPTQRAHPPRPDEYGPTQQAHPYQ